MNNDEQNSFSVPDHDEIQEEIKISNQEESLNQEEFSKQNEPRQKEHRSTHKNKNPYKERISKLINDNHAKNQINAELQQKLAEREQLLALKEEQLKQNELRNQKLFEANLETEESSVLQKLRQAKQDGDIDLEVKLEQDLARVKANQAAFDVLKIQQQNQVQAPYEEDTTFYPEVTSSYDYSAYRDEPELPESYQNFLDRNPWANPNSNAYDDSLLNEANSIAEDFNKRLKFNNQANLIGTDAYYDAIEKVMHESYALNKSNQEQSNNYYQQNYNPSPMTGVSRQGASMADHYAYKNNTNSSMGGALPLTPLEYKIARNLRIPDPKRGPGHYISGNEAARIFAANKQGNDNSNRFDVID